MEPKKYSGLQKLLEQEEKARQYFDSLPDYVQEQISERPQGVNSYESLRHYGENLTRGDD